MGDSALPVTIWSLSEIARAATEKSVQEALKAFECHRDDDVTEFLRKHALDYETQDICRTFLVLEDAALDVGEIVIIAFFALAVVTTVEQGEAEPENLSPAFLIAHLARSDAFSHEQYDGSQLLREAEEMIATASDLVGGRLIYLDCKIDETQKLIDYYTEHGYTEFNRSTDTVKMMKRILK